MLAGSTDGVERSAPLRRRLALVRCTSFGGSRRDPVARVRWFGGAVRNARQPREAAADVRSLPLRNLRTRLDACCASRCAEEVNVAECISISSALCLRTFWQTNPCFAFFSILRRQASLRELCFYIFHSCEHACGVSLRPRHLHLRGGRDRRGGGRHWRQIRYRRVPHYAGSI